MASWLWELRASWWLAGADHMVLSIVEGCWGKENRPAEYYHPKQQNLVENLSMWIWNAIFHKRPVPHILLGL